MKKEWGGGCSPGTFLVTATVPLQYVGIVSISMQSWLAN